MRARLQNFWENLHGSYWFIPSLMAAAAIGLSFGMVSLDRRFSEASDSVISWTYRGGAEGARTVLSSVASSIITVAGVVFSVTITALSLASSQFGPRLLRNFMHDRGNQVVLGTFIATHLYCLLVLRTVRGQDDSNFVPHLAVTVGVALAMASLGVLIYFIHHVARSIQAPNIIAAVAADLAAVTDAMFPDEIGESTAPAAAQLPADFDDRAARLPARHSGYVRAVDVDELVAVARRHDVLLRLDFRPGSFLSKGSEMLAVYPGERAGEELSREIDRAVVVGARRTLLQDVEFAVDQLVEIAVRALSPGINDPFTAMTCVDHLADALRCLAGRRAPSPCHRDPDGELRVVAPTITLPELIASAFDPIRQYGRTSVTVTLHLLDALARLAESLGRDEDVDALARQIEAAAQGALEATDVGQDRAAILEHRRAALQALAAEEPAPASGSYEIPGRDHGRVRRPGIGRSRP